MRKVILSMMVSLDGFTESTDPTDDWFVWDEEMSKYMTEFIGIVDSFIYGKKAYEGMVSYWPEQKGEFADLMNQKPKLVISNTTGTTAWNAKLLQGDIAEKMKSLKSQPGKDFALFGGAELALSFLKWRLIDEMRLIINPVVLGCGKPLFKELENKLQLKLVSAQNFTCGNIILIYQPLYTTI